MLQTKKPQYPDPPSVNETILCLYHVPSHVIMNFKHTDLLRYLPMPLLYINNIPRKDGCYIEVYF